MNATATKNIPADIRADLAENAADGFAFTIRTVRGVSKVECGMYGVRRFYKGAKLERYDILTYDPWAVGRYTFETMAAAKAHIDARN